MTYIDLINRFWELNRIRSFTAYDCKLYFYLLSECNSRRWVNPFELHTRHMQLCIGMSRKTIVESRNRLKQRGLIDVAGARGREAAVYMIKGIKVTDPDLYSNRFVLPDDTTKSNNDENTESNVESNTEGYTKVTQSKHNGELHLIIDKDKRYKTKDTLSHDRESEVENKVNSGIKDQAQSDDRDMFSRCCDHFLSEGQQEYRQQLRAHYGIDNPAAAFAEFRRVLIEEDLLGELHTRQDFARLFKFKYCLRRRAPSPAVAAPTPHPINLQPTNYYETGRNDRFYRRRGIEPTAVRPEDYTSTL